MNEFKGTSGAWGLRELFKEPILIKDEENNREWYSNTIDVHDESGRIVANVVYQTNIENQGWGHNDTVDKWKANALLISKAPELLEMLRELLDNSNVPNEIFFRAKQLINEATEL